MPSADLCDPESVRRRLYAKARYDGDCLIFTGALHRYGYGKLWDGERPDLVHRISWRLERGPIPDGIEVCHSCDNPPCFLPAHLFLGTQQDNLADMSAKGRRSNGLTHSELIKAGWTPELREYRSQQTRDRMRQNHEAAAMAAGVPIDWKRCPRCATWKPRTGFHRGGNRGDGLKAYCKPCSITLDVQRRRNKATSA